MTGTTSTAKTRGEKPVRGRWDSAARLNVRHSPAVGVGGKMAEKIGESRKKIGESRKKKLGKAGLSPPLCQGELGQSPALLIPGTTRVSGAKSTFPCSGMFFHPSSTSLPSPRGVCSSIIPHSCLSSCCLCSQSLSKPWQSCCRGAPVGSALSGRSAPTESRILGGLRDSRLWEVWGEQMGRVQQLRSESGMGWNWPPG